MLRPLCFANQHKITCYNEVQHNLWQVQCNHFWALLLLLQALVACTSVLPSYNSLSRNHKTDDCSSSPLHRGADIQRHATPVTTVWSPSLPRLVASWRRQACTMHRGIMRRVAAQITDDSPSSKPTPRTCWMRRCGMKIHDKDAECSNSNAINCKNLTHSPLVLRRLLAKLCLV